jgi:hypothetical protein
MRQIVAAFKCIDYAADDSVLLIKVLITLVNATRLIPNNKLNLVLKEGRGERHDADKNHRKISAL